MRSLCALALCTLVACKGSEQAKTNPDLATGNAMNDLTGVAPPDLTGVAPPDLTGVAPPDLAGGGNSDMGDTSIWLHTNGNQILHANNTPFQGRGANLQDTRSCNRCTTIAPSVPELKHRIDALVDVWHANFIRLTLESYANSGEDGSGNPNPYRLESQWKTLVDDPDYLADIVEAVDYIGTKPGVYVLVSIWNDPSLDALGWPTAQTRTELEALVGALGTRPHVIFGVSNEPQSNFDGMLDDEVWDAMNEAVKSIRAKETQLGVPQHLVSVQGTRSWARVLDYYVTNPIAAAGGTNIVYETHVYDHNDEFDNRFETPHTSLPVIIGEFGPADLGGLVMTLDECDELMKRAEAIDVPWLAWSFHQGCPPELIETHGTVAEQCGSLPSGMSVTPTEWGTRVKNRLAKAYDSP